jgi:hypothetical protein
MPLAGGVSSAVSPDYALIQINGSQGSIQASPAMLTLGFILSFYAFGLARSE